MINSKTDLRRYIKEKRDNLSKQEIIDKSSKIWDNICYMDQFKDSDTIFLYSSIGSEVDTNLLLDKIHKQNKKIAYPVTNKKDNTMEFYLVDSIDDLKPITFKNTVLLEPDTQKSKLTKPNSKTLMIVPGLAFDNNLYRIGYGGGFYDRYLSKYGKILKSIGVCYDFQLVSNVFNSEYDIPVNSIVTPSKVI